MKVWGVRLVLLGAAVAVVVWGWWTFFPSPERVMRKRLLTLAQLASIAPNEAPLARLANSQKLVSLCLPEVELAVDVPGRSLSTINGRDDLLQAVVMARSTLSGLNVEFFDIEVTLDADRQSAVANLTAKAKVPGDRDFYIQELKFVFKKVGSQWFIRRIETVKTLATTYGL
jgi:hypothetical protein